MTRQLFLFCGQSLGSRGKVQKNSNMKHELHTLWRGKKQKPTAAPGTECGWGWFSTGRRFWKRQTKAELVHGVCTFRFRMDFFGCRDPSLHSPGIPSYGIQPYYLLNLSFSLRTSNRADKITLQTFFTMGDTHAGVWSLRFMNQVLQNPAWSL